MESEGDKQGDLIDKLQKYKNSAKITDSHTNLVKDQAVLKFLAYVLESFDKEVLEATLDTIDILCESSVNRSLIKDNSAVIRSLESLRNNQTLNNDLPERANAILELINSSNGQLLNGKENFSKNKKTLILHVHGLHEETQQNLEDILTKKVKGVHSVIVDVEHQRCIVKAYDYLDPKLLALAISEDTNMEARLVSKNKLNQEILVSLTENSPKLDLEELPPYLDEKESPVKEKAVKSMKEMRITASEWFSVAAGILQKSLYW